MIDVISNVISHKRQHGKGITAHFTKIAKCGGCHFASHRCSQVNPKTPIEGLINKWNSLAPAASKNESTDGYSLFIVPVLVEDGILSGRRCKSRIRMGGRPI